MSSTTRAPRPSGILDLVRREWYLTRLDWQLRHLPSKESRRIRMDLRRSLKDSSVAMGMGPALTDLGHPDSLAEQYTTDSDREGPRWATGAMAAALTAGAIVYMLLAYGIGALDTLVEMGGGTRTTNLWGSETVLVGTASELSMEMTNVLPALAVLVAISAVVFLLFSRGWRLARRSG